MCVDLDGIGEADGGRARVADSGIAGSFHPVGVVPGSLDYARVGAVPPGAVEVAPGGDVGHDGGEDAFALLRGERPPGQ
jgi:hypothetical protein